MLISQRPEAFFTDAEVFQELFHRYLSLRVWPEGKKAFDRFAVLLRDRVEAVRLEDVRQAAAMAERYPHLSARDLLHLAVMRRVGARVIVSADRDFDTINEVERLDPLAVAAWEDCVLRGRREAGPEGHHPS